MLAEYDRAHTDYVAVWYNLGSPVKETRRALKDLGFALRRLNAAVEYWLKYDWEKSHDKRSSAVEKLEKQMKKDKKAIDAVETWLDRITEGYPAQWF
jgi:predicted RNase H-like nuclease (RuvC/YqgF family)